jgi:hypothetical protein
MKGMGIHGDVFGYISIDRGGRVYIGINGDVAAAT